MPDNVLKTRVMCHLAACAWVHHAVVRHRCSSLLIAACIVARFFIVIVVSTTLVRKVLRALVLVCAAILFPISKYPFHHHMFLLVVHTY